MGIVSIISFLTNVSIDTEEWKKFEQEVSEKYLEDGDMMLYDANYFWCTCMLVHIISLGKV